MGSDSGSAPVSLRWGFSLDQQLRDLAVEFVHLRLQVQLGSLHHLQSILDLVVVALDVVLLARRRGKISE